MRTIVRLLIVSSLAVATSLQAITYIVPSDRDLVKRAEAIVIGTAVESHSELRANGGIVTIASFGVERAVKGRPGRQIDIVEPGGRVGELATMIPGSPRFQSGSRYLVFLVRSNQGDWTTYGFELGRFEFVDDLRGRSVLTRGNLDEGLFGFEEGTWAPHSERLRGGPEFVTFVDTVSQSDSALARNDYFVDHSDVIFESFPEFRPRTMAFVPRSLSTRPDYLMTGNYRWNPPSVQIDYCCTSKGLQPNLDGPGAVAAGTANWRSAGAGINYTFGSNNEAATGGLPSLGRGFSDHISAVLFNDPFNDYAANGVPAGVVGIGGISNVGSNYTLGDGAVGGYNATTEGDVVIAKASTLAGISQVTFELVLTHELGHTLGFRHSDGTADPQSPTTPGHQFNCQAPSPCANPGDAVMASTVFSNLGGLHQWDLDAAQTVYGSGPVCTPPSISTQPSSQSISSGNQANLTVAATGTAPLTYQWYIGTSPSTTSPVGGATNPTFHPSPTTTTSYWARVSGCSTFANSNTAVVTVTCAAPSASAPNANPSTIASGQSSTITETPTGSGPFTYQWYTGNSGNTASPIGGATNSSVTVSPTTTTSYWVRVTGQCAPAADSPVATVTVTPCVPPNAPTPIASPSSIPNGQTSTLSVNPSGTSPFTYQWYIGNSGVTTSPIGGATNSFVVVSPSVTTNYWVRVTGQCAPPADSREVTVTVTCSPIGPSGVTAQPSTINAGQSSTLFFFTNGTGPFTIQWYTGGLGDTSNPITGATGTSTIVSPSVTTGFWVHVTAPCGSADSSVIVFVAGAPCIAPSITTQPASSSISTGSPVTVTVAASGTAPFTFQWYTGDKGDVSHPIAGATTFSLTQSPASTTKYWARVSNSCNGTQSADSNAATITVTGPVCTNPSITTQPANVSAPIGTAATLQVVAGGTTPLHYQWFEGVKGDTSKPRGIDSATFVSGAISSTTSFWVHVTGQCGNPADSNAAIVTAIRAPRGRAVRH